MGPLRVPEDCPEEVANLQLSWCSKEAEERPSVQEIVAILNSLQHSPQRVSARQRVATMDREQPASPGTALAVAASHSPAPAPMAVPVQVETAATTMGPAGGLHNLI